MQGKWYNQDEGVMMLLLHGAIGSPIDGCGDSPLAVVSCSSGKVYIGGIFKDLGNILVMSYPVWIVESVVPSEVNRSLMVNIGMNKPHLSVNIPEFMSVVWETVYYFNKDKKKDMNMRDEYKKSVMNLMAMDSGIVSPNMGKIQ